MQTITPTIVARRLLWLALAYLLNFGVAVRADEPGAGRVVPVPQPITTEVTNRLRETTHEILERFNAVERQRDPRERRVFKFVFDFTPDGRASSSKDFGACYELAKYLRSLPENNARAIAYVHGEVTRHTVLPVLACGEIVFSRGAQLGDVVRDHEKMDRRDNPVECTAYDEIARVRSLPSALVRKMYERDLVVVRVPANAGGDRYRAAADARDGEQVLLAGNTARYNFEQAVRFGISQQDACESVADVVRQYQLPRSAQDADPLLDRAPVGWLIAADGPVNGELRERLARRIKRALGAKANLIVLQLRCHGGDPDAAIGLANDLVSLNDDRKDNPVKLIAFVTEEATDAAAFLALACHQIVMQPKAKLGDFDRYLQVNARREDTLRQAIEDLAARQFYPPLLARALVDRNLQLFWATPLRGPGGGRLLTRAELDEDVARGGNALWRVQRRIKEDDGRCLTLDARNAKELGLARDVAEDVESVYRLAGVESGQVHDATRDHDWLDDLANFLRDPWTSVILVMLGITCLILELKMPGVSLPGIIAAVCFVLFFWSHSQLNGQISWLAILLFLLGLLLIGLEVFILPGLGVAGISGIVLVLGSLGLVAYGHWPNSNEEWVGFGQKIGPYGLSLLGALGCAFVLARFLPSIPYANRLMLKPAGEGEEEFVEPTGPDYSGLLGAIGVAATPLRPAGKVQFNDEFVDVMAEGGYVNPGARVQVVETEGNRVVVKEV